MAQDQIFLKYAISGNQKALLDTPEFMESLSLKGIGDGSINDHPALPLIESQHLSAHKLEHLTNIARARIASLIKFAGFCEMKNLVPVFNGKIYGGIVANLLNNAHSVLKETEEDQHWLKRTRVLEVCHEEFLNDKALDDMSITQVIKMRSKAWGRQAASREALFASIREISLEIDNDQLFHEKSVEIIRKYRVASEALIQERENLNFKIKCEMGKAALGGGVTLIGLLSQLSSPLASMGLTLAAGGIWFFDKSKEYIPELRQFKHKETELKRGAGFGLYEFYSRIK